MGTSLAIQQQPLRSKRSGKDSVQVICFILLLFVVTTLVKKRRGRKNFRLAQPLFLVKTQSAVLLGLNSVWHLASTKPPKKRNLERDP
jgi:hypothetical protein